MEKENKSLHLRRTVGYSFLDAHVDAIGSLNMKCFNLVLIQSVSKGYNYKI